MPTKMIGFTNKIGFAALAAAVVVSGLLGWIAGENPSWENQGTVVGVRTVQDQHGTEYLAVTVKHHDGTVVDDVMPVDMGPCWKNAIFQTKKDDDTEFGVDERCVRPDTN